MVKYYKCYKVFLSGKLMKLLMYLVYPLATLLWCGMIALGMGAEKVYGMYALLLTSSMIMWAEMLLDNFTYGGICAKDTNKLEYLKTSHRGMSVLKNSLIVDKLRRALTAIVILVLIYAVCHEQVSVGQLVSLIAGIIIIMELGLLLSRHFTSFNWVLIIAWVVNSLGAVVGFLAVKLASVFVILFLLVAVAVAMISNRVIMKKAKKSFYDTGVEV